MTLDDSHDSHDSHENTNEAERRTQLESESGASNDLSFGEALERLEQTLRRMEDESIDIDDLASELRGASELLEICRGKLRRAEVEVREVVANMSRDQEPGRTRDRPVEEDG